jgi:hypothetical protein
MPTKARRYSPEERAAILDYALEHGPEAAARKYTVPRGTVAQWHRYDPRRATLQLQPASNDDSHPLDGEVEVAPTFPNGDITPAPEMAPDGGDPGLTPSRKALRAISDEFLQSMGSALETQRALLDYVATLLAAGKLSGNDVSRLLVAVNATVGTLHDKRLDLERGRAGSWQENSRANGTTVNILNAAVWGEVEGARALRSELKRKQISQRRTQP